jgi:hypothetical protein
MTEEITVTEKKEDSFEDEFWKRAASFNLNPGNIKMPSDIKSEDIDGFLSKVMQEKMKLPCRVTGKSILINLPPMKDT